MFFSAAGIFERVVEEDTTIGGVLVKKGTSLAVSWVPLLYDPSTFEKPFEFKPERW
jgi:cytochrome P450